MTALVADIGGTRIKLALVRDQIVLAQELIQARSDEGLAPQLPRIVEVFRQLAARVGIACRDCSALGIAFPSLVASGDKPRVLTAYGKYEDAPRLNLQLWSDEELGLQLFMENDARMSLLGEWRAGAGRGSNDLVMVTLGTGLGTAVIIQGRPLQGKHGQAGVLGGHLTVRQGGRLCTCGNRGCAEAEASTSVLPQIASEHCEFSKSRLREVSVIDYATIFHLARERDTCSIALRAHCIQIWSALIVNLIHAYDPDRVIVGGGIMAGRDEFLPHLERSVFAHTHTPWGRVEIIPAQLGDAAALIGCEIMVREELSKQR
jgi:glucokinase